MEEFLQVSRKPIFKSKTPDKSLLQSLNSRRRRSPISSSPESIKVKKLDQSIGTGEGDNDLQSEPGTVPQTNRKEVEEVDAIPSYVRDIRISDEVLLANFNLGLNQLKKQQVTFNSQESIPVTINTEFGVTGREHTDPKYSVCDHTSPLRE